MYIQHGRRFNMKAVDMVCLTIGITEKQLNGGAEWIRTHKDTDIVDTPLWVLISLGYEAIRKESEDKE